MLLIWMFIHREYQEKKIHYKTTGINTCDNSDWLSLTCLLKSRYDDYRSPAAPKPRIKAFTFPD